MGAKFIIFCMHNNFRSEMINISQSHSQQYKNVQVMSKIYKIYKMIKFCKKRKLIMVMLTWLKTLTPLVLFVVAFFKVTL